MNAEWTFDPEKQEWKGDGSTFTFGDSDAPHAIGDGKCNVNWCGGVVGAYPHRCESCPGLVHANFGDENYDGYWLYTQCDQCGESQ